MGLFYYGEAREVKNYIEDILNGYIKNFNVSNLKARINSLYTKQALSVLQYNDLMDYVYAFSKSEEKTNHIIKNTIPRIKEEKILINDKSNAPKQIMINKHMLSKEKPYPKVSDLAEIITEKRDNRKNVVSSGYTESVEKCKCREDVVLSSHAKENKKFISMQEFQTMVKTQCQNL